MTNTKDTIKDLLGRSDKAVARALVVLLDRQTSDEVSAETTKHKNGVGFTAFDAGILTSFAVQVKAGRVLSEKQIEIARRKVAKYAGQLLVIAQAREMTE